MSSRASTSCHDDTVTHPSSHSRYQMIKRIAKDSVSAVFRAYDHLKGRYITIKQTQRGSNITKYVERELYNQRTLVHPHIVRLHEVYLTEEALCMVMDDAPGGNLETLVKEFGPLHENLARKYFQQIVIAVDYCHKRGTCVRNLKLPNLVLDETRDNVKVFDFNLSKHTSHSLPRSRVGTTEYFPPEVLLAENRRTYNGYKADVWSLGVCLFVMLNNFFPFDDPSPGEHIRLQEILDKIKTQRVSIPEVQVLATKDGAGFRPLSTDCQNLLKGLLQKDPGTRCSIEDILHHPWFLTNLPEGALNMNRGVSGEDRRVVPGRYEVPKKPLLRKLIGLAMNRG